MKFHLYFILLLLLLPLLPKAQNSNGLGKVIELHPAVGNIISLDEKKEFGLFPDYDDSIFISAQLLKYNDTTFTFVFRTTTGKWIEIPTTNKEITRLYNQIERIAPAASIANTDDSHSETKKDKKHRRRDSDDSDAPNVYIGPGEINFMVNITLLSLKILSLLVRH